MTTLENLKLKDVTFDTFDSNYKNHTKFGNMMKWHLIGLELKADKEKLEKFKEQFKTGGAYHAQRGWLTQTNHVLDLLKNEKPINGVTYDLEKLKELSLGDAPFSIETVYKNREKQPKAPKDPRLEMAKKAVKDENIETGSVTAKQVLELADMGIPEFKLALAQAEQNHNMESMFIQFPEVKTENLAEYTEVLCQKILEIAQTDQTYFTRICEVTDDLLKQLTPQVDAQVA
jgi:hypothetical protein